MTKGTDYRIMLYHRIDKRGVSTWYNTKIKKYSDGSEYLTKYSSLIAKGLPRISNIERINSSKNIKSSYKSLLRSKSKLIDLAIENGPWEYFVTLTFDKNKVNSRYDYNEISQCFTKWVDLVKHSNKDFAYVFTTERHKDGAFHLHGLIKNVPNLKIIRALNKLGRGLVKNGCKIYNIKNFKYGNTELSKIKNQEAVSIYMSKYMTKDLIDLGFKKKYFRSNNLKEPKIEYSIFCEEDLQFYYDNNIISYEKTIDRNSFKINYLKKISK